MVTKIVFSKTFEEDSYGARRVHVEEAVRKADGFAESVPAAQRQPTDNILVIHTRAMPASPAKPDFVWIVLSLVEKNVQTVMYAFRAYTGDVSVPDPKDSLAVLKSFANVFGLEAVWAGKERSRFLEYAVAPKDVAEKAAAVPIGNPLPAFLGVTLFKRFDDGTVEMRWSFFLDADKYTTSLEERRSAN